MSVYAKTVTDAPTVVAERAIKYFGRHGLGLEQTDAGPECVTFAGGGGHVAVTSRPKNGKTEVELETREWDFQARDFLAQL